MVRIVFQLLGRFLRKIGKDGHKAECAKRENDLEDVQVFHFISPFVCLTEITLHVQCQIKN